MADAENLPFEDNFFDIILSSMVFGLVPNQERMLREIVRLVKPGGIIALATHGPKHYLEFIKTIVDIVPKKYILGYRVAFWPRTCSQMIEFYQNEELTEIITKQSTWEDCHRNGSEMFNFTASSSANFWSASIPVKDLPVIMEKIKKNVTQGK